MLVVIAMMFGGILFGYLARSRRINWIGKIIIFFIWILLFILGVEVGSDPDIIKALPTLGVEALFIASMGILGSAVAAMLLWNSAKKRKIEKGDER